MPRTRPSASSTLSISLCFALAYALLLSLCAPFLLRTASAARAARHAGGSRAASKSLASRAPASQEASGQQASQRAGELLIRFRRGVSNTDKTALVEAAGAHRVRVLRGETLVEKLALPAGRDPQAVAAKLGANPAVEYAEPNYFITKSDTTPNDPRFAEQWALHNTGASGGQAGADIGASQAWDTTTGSASTVIAVIDSGIDFTHPDLQHNEWTNPSPGNTNDLHGWDYVAESNVIKDEQGHGTAVAGIIGAEGNNGTGSAGVMWRAGLMSLRVLDTTGTGDTAMAVEAINYAVAHGAQVIVCAWSTNGASAALRNALERAASRDVVVVCAAGNNGRDIESAPAYPAAYDLPNVVAVAATDNTEHLAAMSNWGATHVAIAAPGTDILTTKTGGGYDITSGTSAAAALVAGVAGLVKSLRPQLSGASTRQMLVQGARAFAALQGKVQSGAMVNAAGAVQSLGSLPPGEGIVAGNSANGSDGNNSSNNGSGNSTTNNSGDNGSAGGNGGDHSGQSSAKAPVPVTGASAPNLPNFDEARKHHPSQPHAPVPKPSDRKSRKWRFEPLKIKHQPAGAGTGATAAAISLDAPPLRSSSARYGTELAALPNSDRQSHFDSSSDSPNGFSGATSDSPFALFPQTESQALGGIEAYGLRAWMLQGQQPSSSLLRENVTWTNITGASASGSTLTKTASDGWNAGGLSTAGIPSGDGYLEFTAGDNTNEKVVGLSHNFNAGYWNIDYAIDLGGIIQIYEAAYFRGNFGTYAVGDVFRISVEAGVVKYRKNGVVFYTSTITPSYPLRASASMYSSGSIIRNALIAGTYQSSQTLENVAWTNVAGASASGGSLTKTAGNGWNAGAISTANISSGDGYMEFTASDNTYDKVIGLSHNSNQGYWNIDFGIYLGGTVLISEAGNIFGNFGAYVPGDRFRVSIENGVVKYRKNGMLFYTSTIAPVYPQLASASLYGAGAAINNAVIAGTYQTTFPAENVAWVNVTGMSAAGNNLIKTASNGWNASALSTRALASGDGYMEFTPGDNSYDKVIGLSHNSIVGYYNIDYGIYAGGTVQVYEAGNYRGDFGPYVPGDRLRVSVENGIVKYRKNGMLFYTSTVMPSYPLLVNVSAHGTGATFNNVVLAGTLQTSGPGNQPPVANAGGPYATVTTGQTMQFNGSGSSDPDGQIAAYNWSFGDGANGTGATPSHIYAWAGSYTVTLTVTDNNGAQRTATAAVNVVTPCGGSSTQTSDYFIANFYRITLGHEPSPTEMAHWNTLLTQAFNQGQSPLVMTAQGMGRTLFTSAEYTVRNRSNSDYVSDLYKAYLQREPDQGGWDYWTTRLLPVAQGGGGQSRANVQQAFANSPEFANLVGKVCLVAATSGSGGNNNTSVNFAQASLDPLNRAGAGGEDTLSQNFNWSVPLVGLKGRAGLDLGLSLAYNSLVWTRSGAAIAYDHDNGSPAPGFRLGFPTITDWFYDAQAGTYAYLLVLPSGERVELRQAGSSNVYESIDSSHLQLTDTGNLTLRTADGTQMTFSYLGDEYQCTKIEDRNGNFITVNYDGPAQQISSIIDTLGRTVTFNYDANQHLISITQPWTKDGATQTHQWATFGWTNKTIQTNFTDPALVSSANPNGALAIQGPNNGESIPVLDWVGLDDGSYYRFDYTSWGQVDKITHYSADSALNRVPQDTHALAYVSYNLPASASTALSDCPRFTERHDWAKDWMGENNVVPAEAVTTYEKPVPVSVSSEGTTHSAFLNVVTMPDRTTSHKIYVDDAGWSKGLVFLEETYDGQTKQRTTTTQWTQDNTNLTYPENPRPTEANVYDPQGNRKRSTIGYDATTKLANGTVEYAGDGTTALRSTFTKYETSAAYTNRHIIGLVQAEYVCAESATCSESSTNYVSKVDYTYDESTGISATATAPTQHDEANYPVGFVQGRGLATTITRWDVISPSNNTATHLAYNTAGAVVSTTDAAGHVTQIDYTDKFKEGAVNRNTFAYPTKVTDADGNSSTSTYNYDLGAVVHTEGAVPDKRTQGAKQDISYDDAGRVQLVTTLNNNASTRYEYEETGLMVKTFTKVDTGADEYFTAQVLDGLGRVRATGGDYLTHDPSPQNTAVLRAQVTRFDVMGRAVQVSNPTGIDIRQQPAGDDKAGWLFSTQTYDWKGRPLVTTHVDSTTIENSYGGCGCAGGEVVTVKDEVGRTQRMTSDVLGRAKKTEVLNWDGTVYSTTTNSYNARDQIKTSTVQAGASGTGQSTTFTYDGYGRLETKQLPVESAATTYAYNNDDTVQKMTDARGVVASFTYNNRHQVKSINYDASHVAAGAATVAASAAVGFDYDAAGNRIWMTDGVGRVDYEYDELSRMKTEKRHIKALEGTARAGDYTLAYDYNLAGELKKITDPFGATTDYTYDRTGQLTDVSGTAYGSTQQYASNMQYRAFGATKHMSYGNGLAVDATYNARLQTQSFAVTGRLAQYGQSAVIGKSYEYSPDGRIRMAHDQLNNHFDRAFEFDHAGRLSQAFTGAEARNYINQTQSTFNTSDIPYKQQMQYDVWGNMTNRNGRYWSMTDSLTATYEASTGRNSNWRYDEAGNTIQDENRHYQLDAAGRIVAMNDVNEVRNNLTRVFDGDGERIREVQTTVNRNYPQGPQTYASTTYYVTSSVLGGRVVTEVLGAGQRNRMYVYAFGEAVAWQVDYILNNGTRHCNVEWNIGEPVTGTRLETSNGGALDNQIEPDSQGVNVGPYDPSLQYTEPVSEPGIVNLLSRFDDGSSGKCQLDGMSIQCGWADQLMESGAAVQAPAETTRYRNGRFEFFRAYADGYQGWGPPGAISNGQGGFVNTNRSRVAPHLRTPAEATRPRRVSDLTRPRVVGNYSEGGGGGQLSLSPDAMFAQGLHFLQSPPKSEQREFTPSQLDRFRSCLSDMFQVEGLGYQFDRNGETFFHGNGTGYRHFYSFSPVGDFVVRTDTQKYSMTQLGHMVQGGMFGIGGGATAIGATITSSPFVNYIANDAAASIHGAEFFGTWVHELGNALSAITNISPTIPADAAQRYDGATDAGTAFEDCVFGGRLRGSGSVSPPR